MRVLLAALLACPAPAADVVLLIEDTPGMRAVIAGTRVPALRQEDRVALVTFAERSRVRRPFTGHRKKLEAALRRRQSPIRVGSALGRGEPEVRLFAAILDACRLFDGRPAAPRAVIALFGSDDFSAVPTAAEIGAALTAAKAKLFALSERRFDYARQSDPRLQTPPTVPGRTPPVRTELLPLPEATLHVLAPVAAASGGEALAGRWDVGALMSRAAGP